MRHARARGRHGTQRRIASTARARPDNRKDRQNAVADEFQHLAAKGMHCARDAIEPGIQRCDHDRWRVRLGQRREAAQIGIEQRGLNGLADVPPEWSGQYPRGAAPAEIGFQRRHQGGAHRQYGQWSGGKARGLTQMIDLVGRK